MWVVPTALAQRVWTTQMHITKNMLRDCKSRAARNSGFESADAGSQANFTIQA